jgi:hypothetical protein
VQAALDLLTQYAEGTFEPKEHVEGGEGSDESTLALRFRDLGRVRRLLCLCPILQRGLARTMFKMKDEGSIFFSFHFLNSSPVDVGDSKSIGGLDIRRRSKQLFRESARGE